MIKIKMLNIMKRGNIFFRSNVFLTRSSSNPTAWNLSNPIARNFSSKDPSEDGQSDIVHVDDPGYISIPEYPKRPDEPLEKRRQRLLYQSRKRGMLENDLLLSTFAAKFLKGMDAKQIEMYDTLINKPSNDWDIYNWALGSKPTPAEYENEIMDMFRKHVKNELKEKRLRMPDLDAYQ